MTFPARSSAVAVPFVSVRENDQPGMAAGLSVRVLFRLKTPPAKFRSRPVEAPRSRTALSDALMRTAS
jgi:hypothetical protein